MPCRSDYLAPTDRELESLRVRRFLAEVREPVDMRYDNGIYGSTVTLDEDTAALCRWCRAHPEKLKLRSLELQIWWRDHRRADARREAETAKERQRLALRESALAKLTPAERRALGVRKREDR